MDDTPPQKVGLTKEETTALCLSTPAIIGCSMTVAIFVVILLYGPFWLDLRHTHKIGLLTSPGRYSFNMPLVGIDCFTLLFCGVIGTITSVIGTSYVYKRPREIRLGIRMFCYLVNLSWLAYVFFVYITFDIGAIQ